MIGIIDYGMGNLHSVKNAFDHLGIEALISSDPEVLAACDKLVLPGVGAFGDMVDNLKKDGLWEFVIGQVKEKKPLLGICLGMQALFENSHEGGTHEGFGFLKGDVIRMDDPQVRIPQIGWNEMEWNETNALDSLPIQGKPVYFYFDHSYMADGLEEADLVSWVWHGKHKVPAIVRHKNVMGIQCHPEKSGKDGLSFLDYFAKEFV